MLARNATLSLAEGNQTAFLSTMWRGSHGSSVAPSSADSTMSSSVEVLFSWAAFAYNRMVIGSEAYQNGGMDIKDGWQLFVESLGVPEIVIFVVGTLFIHSAIFWGFNGFLYHCYRNNWFAECKIQGSTLPSGELYRDCLYHCFVNHFVVGPLTLYFGFPFLKATGMSVGGPVPPPAIFIRDIIIAVLVNDTLFYWGHLLLHHKSIYKVRYSASHHHAK
jgi:hypothetical protein